MRCCAWSKLDRRFSLRVYQRQLRRKLLEHGDRGGLVVHEDAALAGGKDFAAQNYFVALGVDAVVFENGFRAGCGLEDAGDDRLFRAVANHFGGGFAAHQQRQRIHENGFARAGFAGEQVQARAERGDGVIDDGVIFGAQFDEHGSIQRIRAQHSMNAGLKIDGTKPQQASPERHPTITWSGECASDTVDNEVNCRFLPLHWRFFCRLTAARARARRKRRRASGRWQR